MAVTTGISLSEFKPPKVYNSNRKGPVRYVMSHLLRYWYLFIPGLLLQIGVSVIQSSITRFIGAITGALISSSLTMEILNKNALNVLIFGVSVGLLLLTKNFLVEFVAQRIERDTRDELYSALLGKSLTFHDGQTIGDMMSRAAADVRQLNFMINPGFQLVFQAIVGIIVPFIFIALIDVQLLLVPTIFLITFGVTLRKYNSNLTPVAWQQRMAVSRINSRLNETISGVQLVRSSAQESYEREIFKNNIERFKKVAIRQGELQGRYYPLLLLGVATALALAHSVFLVDRGVINFDELITFLLLMQLLRFPTFINIFAITVLTMGVASAGRIIEIIEGESKIDSNPEGYSGQIKGDIKYENVSFGYSDSKLVLKNITFEIHPGQTVAIVGMTGAGKSTITKLLARLYDPQEGSITVDGYDVRDWSIESLRAQMALVEQDIFLFSRSIKENIIMGNPHATDDEIIDAAKLAQIHEYIMTLPEGYDTEIGERGVQLSGGQRQRVAIARAVLRNPRILIMDDASSAIDSKTEDEIQQAISAVLKNRVSFLITHRIAQIRKADHIILLDKGEILDQGTHEELVSRSEKYQKIFSTLDKEAN